MGLLDRWSGRKDVGVGAEEDFGRLPDGRWVCSRCGLMMDDSARAAHRCLAGGATGVRTSVHGVSIPPDRPSRLFQVRSPMSAGEVLDALTGWASQSRASLAGSDRWGFVAVFDHPRAGDLESARVVVRLAVEAQPDDRGCLVVGLVVPMPFVSMVQPGRPTVQWPRADRLTSRFAQLQSEVQQRVAGAMEDSHDFQPLPKDEATGNDTAPKA